jgi:hypothetical protein
VRALEFLSVRPGPELRSPLEHAASTAFEDLSLALAKFEVRGDLSRLEGVDLIRITPRRGLVLAPIGEADAVEAKLQVDTMIDVTGALAAMRVQGEDLMRRLTDLDLDDLPAAGAVARVPAVVRRSGEAFELFWPQEYGHYLALVVADVAEGLR